MADFTAKHRGGLKVEVNMKGHTVISDGDKSIGGEGMGPSPGDLAMGALAACTARVLADTARKHNIKTEGVEVNMSMKYDINVKPKGARVFINREIVLKGALSDEDVKKLEEGIREGCVVKNMLSDAHKITTKFVVL